LADLSLKRTRERLAVRPDPYWQRLKEGAYLGFRRGPDTWIARWRDRDEKQNYQPLGMALEFDEAKAKAEAWLEQVAGSAFRRPKVGTVKEALTAYIEDLKAQGRPSAAADALSKFKTCVWDDPYASLELEALTLDDSLEWRVRLQAGRKNRSVNRMVRSVKAGLTRARRRLGYRGNPAAWDLEALTDDIEDSGDTAVFLNADQRRALIKAANPNAALFLEGLERTGARPKELAAATVADLSGDSLKLASHKGRSGKLRSRFVLLDDDGAAFFKRQTKGKLPGAWLFTEDGSQPWRRHMWGRAIRAAIEAVNAKARGKKRIPPTASAYSFRHARISELLQLYGVDPLTVAAQCGTSLVMIEKNYLRFIASSYREKLNALRDESK
jgi:integrase